MMVQQLMQEEGSASYSSSLFLHLWAKVMLPRIDGSVKGKRNNIDRHGMTGAEILEHNYFKDGITHGPKPFGATFR
jgi:hypothetical protein